MVVAITALLAVDGYRIECAFASGHSGTGEHSTVVAEDWWPLVDEAFTPNRLMQGEGDRAVWVPRSGIDARTATGVEREGRSHIVSLSLANKATMVRAQMRWNGRRYTDYMLLLNVKGGWRITNKIAIWEMIND